MIEAGEEMLKQAKVMYREAKELEMIREISLWEPVILEPKEEATVFKSTTVTCASSSASSCSSESVERRNKELFPEAVIIKKIFTKEQAKRIQEDWLPKEETREEKKMEVVKSDPENLSFSPKS